MRALPLILALLLPVSSILCAQQNPPQATPTIPAPHPTETLVVLGSAAPVPLTESPSSVLILPVEDQQFRVATPLDLLRQDASLFLEQRGAGGAQSDIVLRGGSFAQTLILLNGFRINDSQTAHHNLDLPIPLEALDQIQVLHGAGSTLHGADALSGVVDFLTAAPNSPSLLLRAGGGNFGQNEQALMAGAARKQLSARITADRNFSTGFRADRDYRNEDASLEAWAGSRLGVTDLLFASSDRAFGADQFYGPYPSWERTKGWFAAARQDLGSRTSAAFAYRRHTDDFVLIRTNPSVYENHHEDASWQASLRRTADLPHGSIALFGLEADGDAIRSNNLGTHARNRGAGYLDIDLHPAEHHWTLSAGLREEIFSGGARQVVSPHLAASLRLASALKLRAGGGYGFRIPTYTDLYYSDPTTTGNALLKPESAWSSEAGVHWAPSRKLALSATGFYSLQHHAIDYIRSNPTAKWQAANLNGLRFAGIEASATWLPLPSQSLRLSWTNLTGAQDALNGLQSEYVFNYPVNNLHALWQATLPHGIALSNAVQIAQRYRQTPYPVWDAALVRQRGNLRPYVRVNNAANTGYAEITGIIMPGRSVVAGLAISIGR